ncbi:IPT/TIG domain-containing protein [Bacteroidota bacterium]
MKAIIAILFLFSLYNTSFSQQLWDIEEMSYEELDILSNDTTITKLKLIINDSETTSYKYKAAVHYLVFYYKENTSSFLLDSLNTQIYIDGDSLVTDWLKYYTDKLVQGYLGDQQAVSGMDSVAKYSPVILYRLFAIEKLAVAGYYDYFDYLISSYDDGEGDKKGIISTIGLYGKSLAHENQAKSFLEGIIRNSTDAGLVSIASFALARFDNNYLINIIDEKFRNSTHETRLDNYLDLFVFDPEGQPERSMYAIPLEDDENLRDYYFPNFTQIGVGYTSKRFLEPKFINFISDWLRSENSEVITKNIGWILEKFEPIEPDSTITIETMLDTLISYTDRCYGYEWITNNGTYNSLTEKLDGVKKDLEKGNENAAVNKLEAYRNEVEAQKDKHVTEEGYKFLYYYAGYIIARLSGDEVGQIESISPTITITKTKDFTLTVYGSDFTKKSDVYFNGKKKKTKFISENELEADIKDKDIKKEGIYTVYVSEKKVGRTTELEFTVYKDLPEKIIPILNCVEELDKKKFLAWFGYENYNDGIVYLDGKENEIKGGTKIKGKGKGKGKKDEGELPVIFLPGVHEKVFSVEFDKKEVTWELLKEKAEATEDSPPCEE